ncbi:Rieske 2Fe-2S domain-containing protein [Nitratireductor mangrovi]|uniref:Rieske 2Fe-2S domain-containing protein n=1 Tax=Nitratireductor mangrovi TaxID=2599600 RepID=A0A5B8KYG5_9HYPH|nr:Rieske 2Fe-2S domain-containing protein [Nitratireductor mangrovi]QDZ00653.1 Rieske 2Fe-2S domain-containing protein [Nitratireductor mangrovi]
MLQVDRTRWHPIASSDDLPFRHVFQAQLFGREFAVWRADDGYVNVWENRCLHRGVRLSIGINDGRELKCQYHGWRYANRTAGCTYIPAHPADAPARTITNRTFPVVERYGLVWTAEEPGGDVASFDWLERPGRLALRPIPVNASPQRVLASLRDLAFPPCGADGESFETAVESADDSVVVLCARAAGAETLAAFFVQPVDAHRCVVRGVLDRAPEPAPARLSVLRDLNQRLTELRAEIERVAAQEPAPAAFEPAIEPLPTELAEMPAISNHGRRAGFRVSVERKWEAARSIAGFELRPLEGLLPTFQPGAHIDIHLPNGAVRQYSVVNGSGEGATLTIGVKREPDSQGGSSCLHDTVRTGDVLAISEPRNNFPLRRDATKTLLIAGGIGITPLLSMAQTLQNQGLDYELHYFVRDESEMAFRDRLGELGSAVRPHIGLSAEATARQIETLCGGYASGMHLYLCGPGPMLQAARSIAAESGWPDEAVHFEYFKNTKEIDDSSSFEIALARSALTLQVPAGRSILEVVREHGIDMPSSCEQGACGTCMVTVIEGEPDHQDVYLNDSEKRSGSRMMTCVSRARSPRLVLDL